MEELSPMDPFDTFEAVITRLEGDPDAAGLVYGIAATMRDVMRRSDARCIFDVAEELLETAGYPVLILRAADDLRDGLE
jgi:hypothetical protein